jgi:hypothetical protein
MPIGVENLNTKEGGTEEELASTYAKSRILERMLFAELYDP